MNRFMLALLIAVLPFTSLAGEAKSDQRAFVKMETTDGDIYLELDRAHAPKSVENFLKYVTDGHYDGTIFHRVIPGFMAQGGGFTTDLAQKDTREPIENESKNGLSNARGTIAMARTNDPHSATAQFFINLTDNPRLDGKDYKWGYTVFGKVVRGMETLDAIAAIPTGPAGQFASDVPFRPIVIKKATVINALPADKKAGA